MLLPAILLGALAGALYTVSPLAAWCVPLAAILLTLNAGAYSAVVSGVGDSTGVALVEVYAVE